MIDIHNFARYDGQIIGEGGPSSAEFASFWGALAAKYADEDRLMFGLMNEPHHLDIKVWAETCQDAVTAIRKAGAASQLILLPGTNFDSAATLLETGSVDALMDIKNSDGSVDGLVLDVHKYLDVDNSGTHDECVTDNVDAFRGLAEHLRDIGRLAMVSETGASRSSSVRRRAHRSARLAFPRPADNGPSAVSGKILRTKRVHQQQLGRLPRHPGLERRRLLDGVPDEPDA
jgi:endoglucanase